MTNSSLKSIAKKLSLSESTVSRALNDYKDISKSTKELVNKTVIKMHQKFGFKLYDTKKNYLERNMNQSDLMCFVLDKETWTIKKKEMSKKFKLD